MVFPEPRKPVTIVMGIGAILVVVRWEVEEVELFKV